MEQIPLLFRFKGERTYVHGTDMYNTLIGQLTLKYGCEHLGKLRFTVHRMATKQCHLLLGAPEETIERPATGVCELTIATELGQVVAWLFEVDEVVNERYAYDEDSVGSKCMISENEITIHDHSDFTTVETAVAMTKLMHLKRYDPSVGKWLFTRLELLRPFVAADTDHLQIRFLEDLGRGKLTKSSIYIGNNPIGQVYFSARRT